jgi:hypothetical protein
LTTPLSHNTSSRRAYIRTEGQVSEDYAAGVKQAHVNYRSKYGCSTAEVATSFFLFSVYLQTSRGPGFQGMLATSEVRLVKSLSIFCLITAATSAFVAKHGRQALLDWVAKETARADTAWEAQQAEIERQRQEKRAAAAAARQSSSTTII